MGSHQDRSQDQVTPIAVEPSSSTPPRILVDSTLPASQGLSASSSTQSRVSPNYMIPASSASERASQDAFSSSLTLDEIPSLAQSSFFKSERESNAQCHFTLKIQQHARIGLALGDERSSAKSCKSSERPLDQTDRPSSLAISSHPHAYTSCGLLSFSSGASARPADNLRACCRYPSRSVSTEE
jgi:hypothetical protein